MAWRPWTTDTTAITAATPMMMPSVVSTDLILLARMAEKAMRKFSETIIGSAPRARAGGARHGGHGRGPLRGMIVHDHAVAQQHLAPGVLGDVGLVGDQQHGVARIVQLVEQIHDLPGG